MKYEVGTQIVADDERVYTVDAVIHYEGTTDKSINLYACHNKDGAELIAADNASDWRVGDVDDAERNWAHFADIGDRLDMDAIKAVSEDLWEYISERKDAADRCIFVAHDDGSDLLGWDFLAEGACLTSDMREVISEIWHSVEDTDCYIRRGYGDSEEVWHFFHATDDLPGRAEWGDEDYPVYCLAPWSSEEGDDADCGNWGYYTREGKRIGE